jgi:hypothetical protein
VALAGFEVVVTLGRRGDRGGRAGVSNMGGTNGSQGLIDVFFSANAVRGVSTGPRREFLGILAGRSLASKG